MNGIDFAWWTNDYLYCLLLILIGAFFKTLRYAYRVCDDAGVARLEDKFPEHKASLNAWHQHWSLLITTLDLLAGLCTVGTVTLILKTCLLGQEFGVQTIQMTALIMLHLLVLEMIPRTLAETYTDRLSVAFLPLIAGLTRTIYPLSWLLSKMEHSLLQRWMSQSPEENRPSLEDEIMSIVEQTDAEDLEEEERAIIKSVFEFGDTITREIMTPRVDIKGLEDDCTITHAVSEVKDQRFSRFPVFHETVDDIRGVIHVKDLLRLIADGKQDEPILPAAKEAIFVPESMPINDLLKHLQTGQMHMAVVVDEYGGTAGVVSMEDIIEELVGEIQDEYDEAENSIQQLADGSVIIDARTAVHEANELLDIDIPYSEEYDSLGGYLFSTLGRIPKPGEIVHGDNYQITVQTATVRQIQTVRLLKQDEET